MASSVMQDWALLSLAEREEIVGALSSEEVAAIFSTWEMWARPEQLEPEGEHAGWLYLAGRGSGKTRTGAEWIHKRVESGVCKIGGLIAPTAGDCRDIMVEGESGIMRTAKTAPNGERPRYWPSKRKITFPNGAEVHTYSADEPDRLRGPQHDTLWLDELASWTYPDAFDMAMFGLRLGDDPRFFVSTTPKPVRLIRELLKDPQVVMSTGSTYDNLANLAPRFIQRIVQKYEGTSLGQQELWAVLLDEVPGALWSRAILTQTRVAAAPALVRVVVAIDPAVTSSDDADSVGIIVAGKGVDDHAYVLADKTIRGVSPATWGAIAVDAYHEVLADRIVAETNNGGELVEFVIRTVAEDQGMEVSYKAVTASRGKITRAEPVSALFEQGRAHLVGTFTDLEDQLVQMLPGMKDSPDRVDAMVWALTDLMLGPSDGYTPNAKVRGESKVSHFRHGE